MNARLDVAVVDYGAGNLRSVAKALERSGLDPEIVTTPAGIRRAGVIVLPGVGAFRDAMRDLEKKELAEALLEAIRGGKPYLGLCLGLQLLFDESDEHGVSDGFGFFRGRVEAFPKRDAEGQPVRVPQIGWNEVTFSGGSDGHTLLRHLPQRDYFYFVHSYRALPEEDGIVVGQADYAGPFAAAVARDNLVAVQFHPEKSQKAGKRFLDGFAAWLRAN